ncbi:MAG TPA: hypothetical protein VN152_00425, partial [Sphingopyxis sp.]|nr:hypothetical protein [Sphingopyxis sp.]
KPIAQTVEHAPQILRFEARNAKDAGERNLANQRLSVDRLSVADIDMPVRKMRADAAAFTQKHRQKQARESRPTLRNAGTGTLNPNFTASTP